MSDKKPEKSGGPKFKLYWVYGLAILLILAFNVYTINATGTEDLGYQQFLTYAEEGDVERVVVQQNSSTARVFLTEEALSESQHREARDNGATPDRPAYLVKLPSAEAFFEDFNARTKTDDALRGVTVTYDNSPNYFGTILSYALPILLILGLWLLIMRRMGGGGAGPGAQIFNIGKSKATLFDQNAKVNVTFADVAGLEEAKEEVVEVVDFLKNPKKYTSLGGKIPKGVLLVGPPGTGKTLLAKAVAGEAGVPFFSMSGSDFVEMFVGVGASRVRDLFKQAREKAPCIIFIDEIDAIGRSRGKNQMQGGNDERENTLNQLLVEMDGFSTDKGVILMAATNRPDVLDSALLRPGRFDRQIGVDRPDLQGREAIFKVHLKSIKTSDGIKALTLAEMTPGFAGAEIANVCNEAALVAARRNKSSIDLDDFNHALDRVIGGLEKKNKLISPQEKEIIAYHEAGHAVCGWFLEHASPLVKVTIVPRGIGTLGYAQYLPKEEYITRTEALLDRMCMTFGGRAAEKIVFGKVSTGAQSDLDQVTKMAYSMVSVFGMSDEVGQVSFYGMQNESFAKPYSDETATKIDDEVRRIVQSQYERAQALLEERRDELNIIARQLLDHEVILKSDVERLIGRRPFATTPPPSASVGFPPERDVTVEEQVEPV